MMTRLLILMLSIFLFACAAPQDPETEKTESTDNVDKPLKQEIYYPNGLVKMRGETINGNKHGLWTAYFENGGIWSKNEFDHGVSHGSSIVFHKNGLTYYSGTYTNGEKSGEWSYYTEQGEMVKTVDYDEQ